jgi:hypothetical protein
MQEQGGRGRKWQAVWDASVGRGRQNHSSQRESCRGRQADRPMQEKLRKAGRGWQAGRQGCIQRHTGRGRN